MAKALFINLERISLREILELAKSNEWRLSRTPFGAFGIRTYIGKAVPWKGLKGDAFWEEAKKHGRLAEGLETAITISKRHAGQTGVAIVKIGKFYKVMPYKAAMQMVETGKITVNDIVATGTSYMDLVATPEFQEIVRTGKLMAPVVY